MKSGICLYGGSNGAGWLAHIGDLRDGAILGDGELVAGVGLTEAVWLACDALQRSGVTGEVTVHAPGGMHMTTIDVASRKYYGDLQWVPAPAWVVSCMEIEAVADAG